MNRAVFLDRDGTLIEEKDYLSKPEQVVLYPGAATALKKLQNAGFKLFLVTNQSGVGRGYFTLGDVEKVHAHLAQLLAEHGVMFEKIYIAPEHPDQPSRGRKPSPQFLFDSRDEFGIDLSQSYMIGDKLIDLECGWNAGVKKSILVRTGYGAKVEQKDRDISKNAWVVDDLIEAADLVMNDGIPSYTRNLRAAKLAKGISESEVANQAGIGLSEYYDLEANDDLVDCYSLMEVTKIVQALGTTVKAVFENFGWEKPSSPISFIELSEKIQTYCAAKSISLEQFEDKVGWEVKKFMERPDSGPEDWNIRCLMDICREIGIDWTRVALSF